MGISPGANEKMKSGQDYNDELERGCATTIVKDMIVSDDDSATVNKTSNSSSPPTDNSSYSGSDDETIIESDQPLFLDTTASESEIYDIKRTNNGESFQAFDDGVVSGDDAMMAEFLQDTFESNVAASRNQHESSLTASTFGDVVDVGEMDALLKVEN